MGCVPAARNHVSRVTRALLLAGAFGGLAGAGHAQPHLGLTGGVTYATFSGDLVERADGAYGSFLAGNFEWWLGAWVLDAEFGVMQKGVSNLPLGADLLDFRLEYLELPVTLNRVFRFGRGWGVAPYAGVSFALSSGCGFRFDGQSAYEDCGEETPGGNTKAWDLGLPVGFAFRRTYEGGSRLSLEVRYAFGVSGALDVEGRAARNNVLTVLLGFAVPLVNQR